MTELLKEFEQNTGNRVVYLTKSGSRLYGTDTPESDTDYKGIFVPPKMSVLMKNDIDHYTRDTNNTNEKNGADDVDFQLHSIYKFMDLLKKSETGAVDMLFSMFREDTIVYQDEEFTKILKENLPLILNSQMKAFIGYALGQTKKFGIKGDRYNDLIDFVKGMETYSKHIKDEKLSKYFDDLGTVINARDYKYIKIVMAPGPRGSGDYKDIPYVSVLGKLFSQDVTFGYFLERISLLESQFGNRTKTISNTKTKTDYKALSHALRISLEVEELLKTSFIKFPLHNASYLRAVKQGEVDVEVVVNQIEETLGNVDILLENSTLPKETNSEFTERVILSQVLGLPYGRM